jgi:uncharacterized membrane protein YdbT with pleckstrin-like domain
MLALYGKGFALAVVVGAVAGVVSDIADNSVKVVWVAIAVAVVLVLTGVVGFIRRIKTTYTITDQRLTIVEGLLSRDTHETRLERVQNVNASQSVLERMLLIGTVDFDTAASAEYDFAFRGVAHPKAIVVTVDRAIQELGQTSATSPSDV